MTHETSPGGPDYSGPGSVNLVEDVQKSPFMKNAMISAGREADKLVSGSKDVGYFLQDLLGNPTAIQKSIALSKSEDSKDEAYKGFQEGSNFLERALGGAIPYFVTGATGGPTAAKLTDAVVNKLISSPLKMATTAARTAASDTANAAAQSAFGPTRYLGQRIKTEITDPLNAWSAMKRNQVNLQDPYFKGAMGDVLGSGALGAVEGGLHYDRNPVNGAIAGLMGGITGKLASPMLRHLPNYYTPTENNIVDWAKQEGMQLLTGMDSGSRRLQNFESQLAKSEAFSDTVNRYNQGNDVVANRIAYKAMGLPEKQIDHMTPQLLSKHLDDLGKQYNELEAGTVAKFTKEDQLALQQHLADVSQNPSPDGKQHVAAASAYVNKINQTIQQMRDPLTGRIVTNKGMDGSTFKDIRSYLKYDISKASQDGDINRVNALKPVLDTLDNAVERGVKEAKGTATVKQWKDLNEQYAMTNLVIDHGMAPTGKFDSRKMLSYFITNDPKRLQLENGGRVNDLHKLAKLEYLTKAQDSTIGGLKKGESILNRQDAGVVERFINSPMSGVVPFVARTALYAYRKGYPIKTGLLNMGPTGVLPNLWNKPELFTRAIGQSSQMYPDVFNKLNEYYGKFNSLTQEDK